MPQESELVARLRAAGCVFAEDEAALLVEAAGDDAARLERMAAARIAGAPLEQVLGWAELWERRWIVAPGVFVPRRRSELLVREALEAVRPERFVPGGTSGDSGRGLGGDRRAGAGRGRVVVVDLCCGCGALGGSVALDLVASGHDVELHAADADPAATACARANLAAIPGAHVHDGDLDAPLPDALRGRADILLCNAPYVPSDAIALMPREARDHEPRLALDGGRDGLDILRRAITAAPGWLRPGGTLLFETGHDQADAASAAAEAAGLVPRVVADDDLGATAVLARLPAR
ncbi:methyltransferase [Myceligenerans crystallogenes]|uniref:methyltransferase n=1 Tax=Myceligenerans crystallogenes TaxID=316335 RepID=UPI0031DC5356